MAITYPTSLDTLTNPSSTDTLDSPSHSDQHSDLNDAVEALETKVGADSSAVIASLDYKVNTARTGSDTNLVTGTKGSSGDLSQWNGDGDLVAKTVISLLGTIYPIGCIYISTVATNPNTVFGFGTWAAFGSGKTLVGLDSGDADFDTSEETGGSKTIDISHTHTLGDGYAKIGFHGAYLYEKQVETAYTPSRRFTATGAATAAYTTETTRSSSLGGSTDSTGSATQSIVQPYIVTYMFKRTA